MLWHIRSLLIHAYPDSQRLVQPSDPELGVTTTDDGGWEADVTIACYCGHTFTSASVKAACPRCGVVATLPDVKRPAHG